MRTWTWRSFDGCDDSKYWVHNPVGFRQESRTAPEGALSSHEKLDIDSSASTIGTVHSLAGHA